MPRSESFQDNLVELSAIDAESKNLNVIVDTPKASRNKFKYDASLHLFKPGSVLPAGASFPFDFGFIPSTEGGDGDPLDVMILMDEPAFAGCLVIARLIGVIEAEQTEAGKTERNDRLIAVAVESRVHRDLRTLEDLNSNLIDEIEHFFVSYNEVKGKKFRSLGNLGPERAQQLAEEGIRKYQASRNKK